MMRTQTFAVNPATFITGRVVAAVAVVAITIIAVEEMVVIIKIAKIIVTTT